MRIDAIYMDANEDTDWRSAVCIIANGIEYFSFADGEPEDNTLCRGFSGVYAITKLVELAADAGKCEVHEHIAENWDEYDELHEELVHE